MRIFLVVTGREALERLLAQGWKNILISWEHQSLIKRVLNERNVNLIIDSAAYIAWTKGKEIDIDKYVDFCKEIQHHHLNSLVIVNLDIIPGRFGFVPSKEDIEKSAIKGWENYEKMKKSGLNVMHLFHQYEDIKWLKKLMAEDTDYIGISPANDLHSKARLKWLKGVFSIVRDKKKTHGFGVTDLKILKEIPFYSADSSNWKSMARYGNSSIYHQLETRTVFYKKLKDALAMELNSESLIDSKKLTKAEHKIVYQTGQCQEDLTKLWKIRGVEFD